MPADVFEANAKPRFPAVKREAAVDLHYPSQTQDAVRFTLPPALTVESAPAAAKEAIPNVAGFETASKAGPGSITFFRNVVIGKAMFPVTDYPALHDFYGKLAAKDQETLVLTRAAASGGASMNGDK